MAPGPDAARANPALIRRARAFVITMGVVALFGDMTYEGARGLVGPYLGLLGASALGVGIAAGAGELAGYTLRLVTGWLADRTGAHWLLTIGGYGCNLVGVPGLALAGSWEVAVALVIGERVGKAIRSPARSTLVSYAARRAGVGASFGLEEALDQIGAVAGPLLTALAIAAHPGSGPLGAYRVAFLVLAAPAVVTLVLVLAARRSFPSPEEFEPPAEPAPVGLGPAFRLHVAGAALVGLGFADWALIAFHGARSGLVAVQLLPLLYAGAMAVDGIAALAFGRAFDRRGARVLALSCILGAGAAPLVFAGGSSGALLAGAALWAVALGAQESIYKAAVARLVPAAQRGRAYGIFFAAFGVAWFVGSTAMGWLYEHSRPGLVGLAVVAQLAAAPVFLVAGRGTAAAPQR
ncbi:MAG TPA: MFS transporter [Myxococcaceae bacterium]|nr:MFS transporter [Myxococcaceae bacterium]